MKRVIKHAYEGKSWKNVVSIGDGEAEFNAMRVSCFPMFIWGDREEVRGTAGKVFVNRNPNMLLASWLWESQHFGGNLQILWEANFLFERFSQAHKGG